ncbi:2,3-bisphosphoglycerate-dependent phosphoglycerate mutase [uncultured archaeon]|nr:2,3-bisphosphoglycerate-dependent phosphoglycerate mutase [uncultured archaeon]
MVTRSKNLIKTIKYLIYRFHYLINYMIIGVIAVATEILIARYVLIMDMSFIIKVIIGFLVGVSISFILNSKLNFKVPKSRNTRTFVMFIVISTIAFVINLVLIEILKERINLGYGYLRFISAVIVFALSYTAHRRITFDFVKKVGIAVYLNKNGNIFGIYSKIKNYADFIHIDLIDKSFNPEAAEIDLSLVKEIDKSWGLKKILHIMSKTPSKWIKKLSKNVDVIIFHLEIDEPVQELLTLCKNYGKQVGICLKTQSKIEDLIKYLPQLDFVQVMGIDELGRSGQLFNPESLEKVSRLNELSKKYHFQIIFDGGVKPTNVRRINAKYIVSGSGILSSDDPIKSFLELKTSSRYRDIEPEIRGDIIKKIKDVVSKLDFVISGNLVGSFPKNEELRDINDIDVVLITKELNKNNFNSIVESFNGIKKELESRYGFKVLINPTLGPLKFNEDCIVFHLMIYDIESHISHCEKSPFTCLDWQRSKLFIKKPMSEIYKVRFLQPSHFFNSRRSATEYLSEIKSNQLSFREYTFNSGKVVEQKKFKTMNSRDRIEFSYHITKFLMINFLKLYHRKNKKYELKEVISDYFKIFPKNEKIHKELIREIAKLREAKDFKEPSALVRRVELFIEDFESQFRDYFFKDSKEVFFMRHAKTKMNKEDLFIGQKTDAELMMPDKGKIEENKKILGDANLIFSSPSKRCRKTIGIITEKNPVIINNLNEIDYGSVEGKDLKFLASNYPEIIEQWEFGNDPKFPNGENTMDVHKRIRAFIEKLKTVKEKKVLVCTHNVVIRIIIGSYFKLPPKDWFKIRVPYFEPIKFILTKDNRFYIELSDSQIKEIFKDL